MVVCPLDLFDTNVPKNGLFLLIGWSELQNVTDISVRNKMASWGKKFVRTKKIEKTSQFWEDLCKKDKIQWANYHELIVYPHLFITRNLLNSVL